ncbi:hypothetical protein [Flavobacterium sp. UBA6135]|uniref:hypothetical protein n=1 Tax=Flavobacterium sp. UBA6135 TaxID=1946553 RepID=UPI0025C28A31|nr:hypothetical protein [Flavobacterium sp. UBA6135]
MTYKQEKFLKHYNEEKNTLRDPEILLDEKEMIFNSRKIKKVDFVGDLILLFLMPLIVFIVLYKFNLDFSFRVFCFGVSLVWIIIILKTRANRIKTNNNIRIDIEKELVTITPIDYLRKDILKQKGLSLSFNSIDEIETKRIKFDKLNIGTRINLSLKKSKINLIDIWTKSLGDKLAEFTTEIILKK